MLLTLKCTKQSFIDRGIAAGRVSSIKIRFKKWADGSFTHSLALLPLSPPGHFTESTLRSSSVLPCTLLWNPLTLLTSIHPPTPHPPPFLSSHSLHLQSHLMTVSVAFLRLSRSGFNKVLHSFLLFPPHFTALLPLSAFFQLQFFPFSQTRVYGPLTNAVEKSVWRGRQRFCSTGFLPFYLTVECIIMP